MLCSSPLPSELSQYSTPALRANTLTSFAKRWQLWGNGVRGEAADEIIGLLYPDETGSKHRVAVSEKAR